jgi:hypothetical protein
MCTEKRSQPTHRSDEKRTALQLLPLRRTRLPTWSQEGSRPLARVPLPKRTRSGHCCYVSPCPKSPGLPEGSDRLGVRLGLSPGRLYEAGRRRCPPWPTPTELFTHGLAARDRPAGGSLPTRTRRRSLKTTETAMPTPMLTQIEAHYRRYRPQ